MKKDKIKVYPLYLDLQAKNLFGTKKNIKYTMDFLECYLNKPKGSLNGLKITNSVVLLPDVIKKKKFELDIKIKLPNKNIILLEFYSNYNSASETKSFIYLNKVFGSQLNSGDEYNLIHKVKQINIVKDNNLRNNNELINEYLVTNAKNPLDFILKDYFKIDIVNLESNEKSEYNKINKGLASWIKFIKAENYKEMKRIAKTRPILKEALEEMKRFSKNEEVFEGFTKEWYDRNWLLAEINDGFNNGKEEGIKLKALEIAKNLKNKLTIEEIANVTGLTKEELNNIF